MLDSILRTFVPYLVGGLIVLAAKAGLHLHPDMTITQVVTLLVATVYYWIARAVEQAVPGIGQLLLSLGLASRVPVYVPAGTKVVAAGEQAGEHWPQPGQM